MGQIDDMRVQTNEQKNTLTSADLSSTLDEIDSRITSKNVYPLITRVGGYISEINYYSDLAHTKLTHKRVFTRTIGVDLVPYIIGIVTTFYNADGSTDSVITTVLNRTSDIITGCTNSYSTTEPLC
jgi:hypothetical protein